MTEAGELFATIGGKDVGLSAILQKIEAEMQHGGDSAVKLGQQYARLAQAQGQPALASQVLAGTLQRAGGASERAILGIETQAARLATGSSAFQEFGKSAASSLAGMVGPAALATSAIGATIAVVKSFGAAFTFKAELDATTASIKSQLDGFKEANAVYSEAIAFGQRYRITQQETNNILSSSTDILRTTKSSVSELETALIRLQSRDVSKPISEASRALRELQAGDTTSIKELFNVPAKDANRMKQEILAGGDAVKVLTAYLDGAKVGMAALEQRSQGAQGAMNQLTVAQEDLTKAQAQFAQGPGLVFLDIQTRTVTGLTRVLTGDFRTALAGVANDFGLSIGPANDAAAAWSSGGGAALQTASAYDAATASMRAQAAQQQQVTTATAANIAAQQQAAAAMQTAAQASVADTAAKDAQAATTALVTYQTQQAAQAFLALNPNITGSGVASALASGQIKQAVSDYINMTLAAQNARNQLAALQAQAGVQAAIKASPANAFLPIGRTDLASASEGQAHVAALQTQTRAEKDLADARRQQIIATGSAAQKQALYTSELQKASREYGANSAQAIRAKTALDQYNASQKKAGGGGGAKLSDQQKLNNSLLTDQEKYQDQSADKAAQYAQDVEKIYADYYEKMRQAQRDFDQDSLEGRASFYDNLGSIESAKIRQSASAQYEAAAQEAGQIAAEKGADVADKYMQAQEQVISARAKRLAEIEKASKEKDAGKAEYLKGVDEAYRRAEDAKLARIKEGDGSLASERDKQLGEAADKDEAAQDKLATAAERAADRKIAAADRAGKKIDEEAARTAALATTYDKIAAAGAPTTTATTAAPGATPAAAPAAGAPADPLAAAIDGAREAIVAALAAIERAQRDTTGAVRNLKAGGGVAG